MKRHVAPLGLVVALIPATALAQAASPDTETQLQQDLRHRRVIVRPLTPADEVQHDVDTATSAIQQQEREQAALRDVARPAQRPPQADQDLIGGIQTRSLNNLLRR
jgi:hypothetical protein